MEETHNIPGTHWTLPQCVYEALRWILTLVLPGVLTLLAVINESANLNLPMEAVYTIATAIATFIGAIFGISKVNNDRNIKEETGETDK